MIDQARNRKIVDEFIENSTFLNWYKSYCKDHYFKLRKLGLSYVDLYHDALIIFIRNYNGSTASKTFFGHLLKTKLNETLRIRSYAKELVVNQVFLGLYHVKLEKSYEVDYENLIQDQEIFNVFRSLIKTEGFLTEKETIFLNLYLDETSDIDIASTMGITKSRVFQLRQQIIVRARKWLLKRNYLDGYVSTV